MSGADDGNALGQRRPGEPEDNQARQTHFDCSHQRKSLHFALLVLVTDEMTRLAKPAGRMGLMYVAHIGSLARGTGRHRAAGNRLPISFQDEASF
ncbi:MAG: hypothetical protein R3315_04920 [Woeseiaceae bacterium]|nr:hypothetical protein [Woeseiaceae bacterium]